MTGTHGPNASGDEQSNQPQTRAVAVALQARPERLRGFIDCHPNPTLDAVLALADRPPADQSTRDMVARWVEYATRDPTPIEDGRVNRAGEYPPGAGTGKNTPVAFSDEIGGETWTLIVALQPRALIPDGTHAALTVYRGPPSESPETADSAREVTT